MFLFRIGPTHRPTFVKVFPFVDSRPYVTHRHQGIMAGLHNAVRSAVRGALKEAYLRFHTAVSMRGVRNRNPVLVYQMGKVGSSTVVRTLEQVHLDAPVFHVHTLDCEVLEKAIHRQRTSGSPFLHEHLLVSRALVRRLAKGTFPTRLITLTREPVSRAISFVFEDWQKKAPDAKETGSDLDVESMIEALNDTLDAENGISDPSIWFDNELKAVFDVDVFSVPFDREAGYTIIDSPVPTLILRLEDLDRALVPSLAEFLDVHPNETDIADANVGSSKWYGESLKQVKRSYRMPGPIADSVLSTRYVRHFYPERLDELRERWTRSGDING